MITPSVMLDFLKKYRYEDATLEGCEKIYNTWKENKADLLERFRKHPNWDEDNLAIVFKEAEYERGFDASAFRPFLDWVENEINKIVKAEGIINPDTTAGLCDIWCEGEQYWVSTLLNGNVTKVSSTLDYIMRNCNSQFIDEEQAQKICAMCQGIQVNAGLKLTKAVQKVCKILDLDKVKDIRQAHENTDRMKDFGFNYQFQLLADSINPTKFKRITVISLNPLDYWGMSFGYKWASCHTIDLDNVRNTPNNHFHGEWSGGTESYMLDSSSIIFYVIREDYEGNTYWDEDKMQRVVFCVNENASMILESRVYPDGRDGGDHSLAQQFRNAMQKVISDLYDINNYWRVEKGTGTCSRNVISTGSQYEDYFHYGDVNISFNKDECLTLPKIKIGHDTICPCCGSEHDYKENIMCYDCADVDVTYCAHCGERINMDYGYEYAGDDYYCCAECAEADGYCWCEDTDSWEWPDDLRYCENDGCYHFPDNCYEDDYDNCYYYGDPEIETEDGNRYSCVENAESDGYHKDYFSDEWMCDLEFDEYECEWFDPENEDAITTNDGRSFLSEASAQHAGYTQAWIKEAV